jgi:histidine triad (HIT) family protein
VIPKEHIPQLSKSTEDQKNLLGHLLFTAQHVAKEQKLLDGFRFVINDGKKGGNVTINNVT